MEIISRENLYTFITAKLGTAAKNTTLGPWQESNLWPHDCGAAL
jgi:hypothetical protein